MLVIEIMMRNPQSGSRGLVRLSSTFNENMELGTALMNFDEDVHNEVMFDCDDLHVMIGTRSRPYMSTVLQHVQNVSAPPPISAPYFASAVSGQSMSHRPYA